MKPKNEPDMISEVMLLPPEGEEPEDELEVEEGYVLVLRLYDLAYSFDMAAVERLASEVPTQRIRLMRTQPKAVSFGEPPLAIALGSVHFSLAGHDVHADASARLYPFGTVTLVLKVPASGRRWSEYASYVTAINRRLSGDEGGGIWGDLLERVRLLIGPAMERPSPPGIEEDFCLSMVHRFNRPVTGEEILRSVNLAGLLAGEPGRLSAGSKRDLLRHAYSYLETDLVVIAWDHAFIYEPESEGGESDVAEVLEVANVQLLEMRYYDEVLDGELPRMYDRVQEARGGLGVLSRRRYANLARSLQTQVAEVIELSERVDNTLIVTEDTYLARVYGAALELFRVAAWSAAVDRKLATIRETYSALYDEAATTRAEVLELTIVLLIVFEIVMAFWTGAF